ncbi:GT2 family glycosyltransferase [Pseudomonas sp. TE3786]
MKSSAIVCFLWDSQLGVLREFFRRHGPLTVVTLSPYATQALLDVVNEVGAKLFVIDHELGDAGAARINAELAPLQQRIGSYLETPLSTLEGEDSQAIVPVIGARLHVELPLLLTLLQGLELAQESYRLCLMIASEDVMSVAKVGMLWAREQGIPSLHLSHALALNDPHTVHAQLTADKHAVYGQRGLEGYLDYGVPAERMCVTGNPAWDKFVKLRGERGLHDSALREKYALREGQPIVVFGTTWTSSLTAQGDEGIFGQTVGNFIDACEALRRDGVLCNPIVKDRPPNYHFGERRFKELLAERGADPAYYFYLVDDAPLWAAAADVLIAIDSNYCVEAMLCGTPAINLQHPANSVFGPCYDARAGVSDVEASGLAAAIGRLLVDSEFRAAQVALATAGLPYFNLGIDGLASARVAELMSEMAVGLVPKLLTWLEARLPIASERALIAERLQRCQLQRPVLGVLVLDSQGNATALRSTLHSLQRALPAPIKTAVFSTAAAVAGDAEVEQFQVSGETLVEAVNAYTVGEQGVAPFDWLIIVEAGVEFTQAGLLLLCLRLAEAQAAEPHTGEVAHAFFCDELQRTPLGAIGGLFKPDFNLDLLLSFPAMVGRHWALRQRSVVELDGFNPMFAEAFQLDLQLRLVHGCAGLGLHRVPEVLLIADLPSLAFNPAEQVALEQHLAARGYQATVQAFLPGRYYIDYGHPQHPKVSIVVAVRDHLPLVQRCVDTLLEKTRYANYELLLVDCGSQDAQACSWLASVEALNNEQVRVWRFDGEFNFAAMVNAVAATVEAEYLLLLSHDVQVVQEDWLEQLLNHAQRPEVGVVGAKVLDPQGKIEQAGIILGLHDVAGRGFAGEAGDSPGYMNRLQVAQNYSAVGAACLMVRRELLVELGGMDEQHLSAFYGDVDLCLRIRAAGFLNVWTPHSVVVRTGIDLPIVAIAGAAPHQAALKSEREEMYRRWLPILARDPAYNPNLSLAQTGFQFDYATRRAQPILPQVLCYAADSSGCGHYRIRQPFAAMRDAGIVDGLVSGIHMSPVELERFSAQTVVFQRQITDYQIAEMAEVKELSNAFKVYELDDYLPNLPLKSYHRDAMPKDVRKSLRRAVALTDRFVVSTAPLAEAFADMHSNILVVPNRLPVSWWSALRSQRGVGRKPRVGWAGGAGHAGDLELIVDVVRDLADEVEWVFLGMCPESLKPFVHEFHTGVVIEHYPAMLASLNLDLALAPLEQNQFNDCKSNLRLLEYGVLGFPVICSDVLCYRDGLPVTRVKNRYKNWVDAIRMHLADMDATAKAGDELQQIIRRDWMLEGVNLHNWAKAWLPD